MELFFDEFFPIKSGGNERTSGTAISMLAVRFGQMKLKHFSNDYNRKRGSMSGQRALEITVERQSELRCH